MTRLGQLLRLFAASAVLVLPACAESGSDQEDPSNTATTANSLIHRTIVVSGADGAATVRELKITMADRLRDIEIRRLLFEGKYTASVALDTSCAASSMWLFSQPSLGGSEICFYQTAGPGHGWDVALNLNTYGWASAVRSFWAGSQDAFFANDTCAETYNSYARRDTVTSCVAASYLLGICVDASCI